MTRPFIFMFSGQGSQYFQMGKVFFEQEPIFRQWMEKMDAIIIKMIGRSIVELLYYEKFKKNDLFDRMLYTHPAIFMVEYSLARLLKEMGIEPDYLLGSSLGEYTTAAVAEVISIDEMLEILISQAKICEKYCKDGGMIAIFDKPEMFYSSTLLNANCEIASINFKSHFVVSASNARLNIVTEYLKQVEITFQKLPVRHAFHSSMFNAVQDIILQSLEKYSYLPPKTPLISCSTEKILNNAQADLYWRAARNPIQFEKTILEIEKNGGAIYLDLGPSGTLSTFIKYILANDSESEYFPILTPFGQDTKNINTIAKMFATTFY